METERIIKSIVVAFIFAFITSFVYWLYISSNLLFLMEKTAGINPTLFVLSSSFLSIIVGIASFFIINNNYFSETLSTFSLSFFIILGILNFVFWYSDDSTINIYQLSNDKRVEYFILKHEKDGFSYIGEVIGSEDVDSEEKRKILLFVKSIEGKNYYYASAKNEVVDYCSDDIYLVDIKTGIIDTPQHIYTIEYDFDGGNNYSKNSEETKENNHNEESETSHQSENHTEPQKIVVEHTRAIQPVQKWQDCGSCGGNGRCAGCNGAGQNPFQIGTNQKCHMCNGTGVCSFCGGRCGYYITVYE